MRSRFIAYLGRHHWGILATFIALGGTAYAGVELPSNSVGTKQLRRHAVTLAKIAPGAQATLRLPRGRAGGDLTGSYPEPTIRRGAVTAADIAPPPAPTAATYNVAIFHRQGIAGWGSYGAPYGDAAFYRDNEDTVHLSGVAKSSSSGTFSPNNACLRGGLPIFQLPAGDRPDSAETFAVDSNGTHGAVEIRPDGFVSCTSGAGDQYVSLDGISFRAGG